MSEKGRWKCDRMGWDQRSSTMFDVIMHSVVLKDGNFFHSII